MEADIRLYDVVDSTNTVLEELYKEGAKEGTTVVAMAQTAGQGRSGRSFYSPEGGNLYMSLLLFPDKDECTRITVIAAVAVVEAVKSMFDMECGIKWVNDIILDGRKVCGIVAKAHDYGSDSFHIILGIGINIYEAEKIPDDIRTRYVSLTGVPCDLSKEESRKECIALANKIIERFSYYYENEDSDFIDEYRKHSVIIGKDVEYISGDEVHPALAVGIDDEGGLILKTAQGTAVYRDGEIRIRQRQA